MSRPPWHCLQNHHLRSPPGQDGASSPSPRGVDGSEEQDGHARQTIRGKIVVVIVRELPAAGTGQGPPTPVCTAAAPSDAPSVHDWISGVVHGTTEDGQDRDTTAVGRRLGQRQFASVPGRATAAGPRPGGVHFMASSQEEVQSDRQAVHLLRIPASVRFFPHTHQ